MENGVYFALATDGLIYCLSDCGDFEAAEDSARDLCIEAVWIADESTANSWLSSLKHNLES
jgi:hypothetical protein